MISSIYKLFNDLRKANLDQGFVLYRYRNLPYIFNALTVLGICLVGFFIFIDLIYLTDQFPTTLLIRAIFIVFFIVNYYIARYITRDYKLHVLISFYVSLGIILVLAHSTGNIDEYYVNSVNFLILTWFVFVPFRPKTSLIHASVFVLIYFLTCYFIYGYHPISLFVKNPSMVYPIFSNLVLGTLIILINNLNSASSFLVQKSYKESEEKYKALVERANDGIVIIQDEHIRFINQRMANILGYNVWDLINKPFIDYIHPDERKKVADYYQKRYQGEEVPSMYESALIDREQKFRPVEFNSSLINFMGKPATQVFIRDITQRKLTELELKESQERYRVVIEGINDGIFDWDLRTDEVYFSKRYKEILGFQESEFPNSLEEWKKRLHPDEVSSVVQMNSDFISGKNAKYEVEYRMLHKDSSYRWILARGVCIRNEFGVPYRMCGVHMDITKRKKLEQELSVSLTNLEKEHSATLEQLQSFYIELQSKKNELLILQKENIQSQFATLKNQINPHFLFNSLNVLTSLITVSPDVAEKFTIQLAKIYRYVLEFKSEDLTSLRTELDFLNSYIYLLDIRFTGKLMFEISLKPEILEYKIVPLAIQLIIENAIKHNSLSVKSPLVIKIYSDSNDSITIENNLQKRDRTMDSTGVGIENIKNRYAFFTDKPVFFGILDDKYIARIPLLN